MEQATVEKGQAAVTLEHWHRFAKEGYTVLPYVLKFELPAAQARIPSWLPAWEGAGEHAFVLESGKGGRYTFLGLSAASVISGKGRKASVSEPHQRTQSRQGEPLELIQQWMAPYRAPRIQELPKFTGGCVGYLSYDVARSIERLPLLADDDLDLPDYIFMQMNELWIVDQQVHCLYCAVMTTETDGALSARYAAAEQRAQAMKGQWDDWRQVCQQEEMHAEAIRRRQALEEGMSIDIEAFDGVETAFPKERFKEAVRKIQNYISQGDVFQVNLSMRQMRKINESAERLYEWIRELNPSPYMGLLRFPEFQLVSCSPELLVRAEQGEVSARPIAGTRRRGHTPEEDAFMAEELITNEKERAEHIMLVDLVRNDLGRISQYGSVRVDELMVIEYYSHVMHLVSEVKGALAAGKDAIDVIRATFPGGTITGAPKVRTMEIIEELEPVRRGPYTGSFGWIDYNGDMELNIIIRTLTLKDGVGHIQAGAGIVIDSDPEREYAESLNKAKALWKAVQMSERDVKERTRTVKAVAASNEPEKEI